MTGSILMPRMRLYLIATLMWKMTPFVSSDHPEFCENITVTNCVTANNCNAIKFGTASHGGYRNIAVSIVLFAGQRKIIFVIGVNNISADVTVISGVAIEMVDGGIIDGITVSNISMRDVQTPIFIRLGRQTPHLPERGWCIEEYKYQQHCSNRRKPDSLFNNWCGDKLCRKCFDQ